MFHIWKHCITANTPDQRARRHSCISSGQSHEEPGFSQQEDERPRLSLSPLQTSGSSLVRGHSLGVRDARWTRINRAQRFLLPQLFVWLLFTFCIFPRNELRSFFCCLLNSLRILLWTQTEVQRPVQIE
ncbi:unnamed protein product [Pleuronectes platessa]|uniref:Uncharacterized protein n=1 Tax=Pleuronectes platessa TaxID=8262 RepID=A0A9N7TIE2_PLEPL|nr:unnamed protein product [Pleuronectes platessa]